MTTAIATWGNSEAVRIPRDILRRAGLRAGDRVDVSFTEGVIEITPSARAHRRVAPAKGITFDTLFRGYEGDRLDNRDAWPSDDLVGAEWDAWSS